MRESILNISYIAIQLIFGFVPGIFLNYMQESKFKYPIFNVLIMAFLWDAPFIMSYITSTKQPFGIISLLLLIIVSMLIYKNSLFNRILNIVLYFIVLVPLEILAYIILQITMDINTKEFAVLSALLSLFLVCLVLFPVGSIIKNRNKNNINKNTLIYLIIPASQIFVFYLLSFLFVNAFKQENIWGSDLQKITPITLIGIMTLYIGTDIWIFKQYTKSINAEKLKAENTILEEKNKLNYQYFSDLTENELELRKIKHDIGGALEIVKELIYDENDIKSAEHLFDELSETVRHIDTGYYCKNSLINAIVTNKSKTCKKENIEFNVSISISENLGISDSDICRALLNMLDNSIEANLALEDNHDKFVSLTVKTIDDYLYIKTENPCKAPVIEKKTSKDNKEEHGYGLKILEQFAKDYNGSFTITNEKNSVSSLLTLKLN